MKKQKTSSQIIETTSSNNFTLSNYLFLQIIKEIIDYLLIYNKKKYIIGSCNNNEYSIKLFNRYINEIIIYSQVSKTWFELISNLISNNIRNTNKFENWFNRGGRISNNHIYSIIKIEQYIIDNYFKNQILIINNLKNYQELQIVSDGNDRKVIANIVDNKIIKEILLNKNELLIKENIELNINKLLIEDDYKIQIEEEEVKQNLVVNKIDAFGSNFYELDSFDYLKYLQPKHFKINPNGDSYQNNPHMNYSKLFNVNNIGKRIESIKVVGTDHVELEDLSTIDTLQNLTTLMVPLLFHDIAKESFEDVEDEDDEEENDEEEDDEEDDDEDDEEDKDEYGEDDEKNGCDSDFGGLKITGNLKNDWDGFIETLSLCKQLKNLTISNFCKSSGSGCFNDDWSKKLKKTILNTKKHLANGIKSIFENNNLHYLKLLKLDFICQSPETVFSPLVEVTSNIKYLILKFVKDNYGDENKVVINYLISKLLVENKSLTHFSLNVSDYCYGSRRDVIVPCSNSNNLIFELLIKYGNQIKNLYSFGLDIDVSEFKNTINNIQLFSNSQKESSIKEFNLTITNNSRRNTPVDTVCKSITSINGIIINILIK